MVANQFWRHASVRCVGNTWRPRGAQSSAVRPDSELYLVRSKWSIVSAVTIVSRLLDDPEIAPDYTSEYHLTYPFNCITYVDLISVRNIPTRRNGHEANYYHNRTRDSR